MRRLVLIATTFIVLLGLTGGAFAAPLAVKGGDAVSVAVYIATVDSGRPVVEQDSRRLLTPASILKSLTVATAYRLLGPEYRWTTTVAHTGAVDCGVLRGDLIIKGGGDPTLGSRHFKEQPSFCSSVAAALRERGITRIAGNIVIDSSCIPDPGAVSSWEVEDIPWDYGAGAYAVNYSDNTFGLNVPSMTTSIPVPDLQVINETVGTGRSLTLSRGVGSNVLRVGGSLGKRRQATLMCSMPDPGAVLVGRLESALRSLGIVVEHEAVATSASAVPKEILAYKSPRLAEVGRSLMVRSDNLMAEATLRAISPGAPLDSAISRERRFWRSQGLDLSTARINDGSGLSRANAISAEALGTVLRIMANPRGLSTSYIDSFARVGLDGTLTSFLAKHPRKSEFVLKSGSMGGVQCYAGYHLNPVDKSPTHVIVVMVNNLVGSRTELRKAIEQMLLTSIPCQ